QETEVLFVTLNKLKESGKTILFISHKLREVKQIADRITVMRDGRVITTDNAATLTEEDIAHLMVGREIRTTRLPASPFIGRTRLKVRKLSYISEEEVHSLKNISFDVRAGEILGLAGVEGNGQSELIKCLTGLLKPTSGVIYVDDQNLAGLAPRAIRNKGVSHIPEDRMENGVAEKTSVEENFIVNRYFKPGFSKYKKLNWKFISDYSSELIKNFKILTRSSKAPVASLSGGNIQKVVVARELSLSPEVIIAAQPTRGIDVGSEEHIHNLLKEARDNGKAVFLISADLDEVLKLSSRIIVIYNGEITAHFENVSEITGRDLSPYMLGVKKEEGASGEIHS
ncbi:MAG: ATP-binding cassette domain-containing protein, partial [Spirochaetota bacterium]